jgi:peptidoglycan/xylan/chitin deacetylase (PgdA/CDA1 family)
MFESLPELAGMAGGALAGLGVSARWNWWRPHAPGLPVLMYHKIGDPPPGSRLGKLWVSTARFRRQMAYLKAHGYQPLTFGDIAAFQDRGEPVPPSGVVITFDDGYKNNHENAYPVLREFGFRAVIYLVVEAIGRDNFWHDPATEIRIPMLTWKEVQEMQAGGMEFDSHTLRHPRLSRLDNAKAREEIQKSREVLTERLGRAPVSFAYPYGDGADEARLHALVREAGYRWAVSVHQGKADLASQPYGLRRIFVRGDDWTWDFHLNMTRGRARF